MTQLVFLTPCRFVATAGGAGSFVVGSAVSGFDTPENLQVLDGKVYRYFAQNADGSIWERGSGAYTVSSHTLARTVAENSSATFSAINFASAPDVSVFPSKPTKLEVGAPFPAGTLMLFQQTSAPVGWTKQTTHNDKALRVVSGSASSGGTNSFSSMFTSRTSDGHTLSIAELAIHDHTVDVDQGNNASGVGQPLYNMGDNAGSVPTHTTGSSTAHSHTYDMRVQYVDLIIASKD